MAGRGSRAIPTPFGQHKGVRNEWHCRLQGNNLQRRGGGLGRLNRDGSAPRHGDVPRDGSDEALRARRSLRLLATVIGEVGLDRTQVTPLTEFPFRAVVRALG
jgi:V8-like Glu-specific endopeptidase